MRIRLPELFEERGLTAYAVAQQSDGRISTSVLYRLLRSQGKARYPAKSLGLARLPRRVAGAR